MTSSIPAHRISRFVKPIKLSYVHYIPRGHAEAIDNITYFLIEEKKFTLELIWLIFNIQKLGISTQSWKVIENGFEEQVAEAMNSTL